MSSAAALMNRFLETRQHDEFMGFAADDATREMLAAIAEKHAWPAATALDGGITAAIQLMVTAPSPRRLVVDLSENPDPVTAVQMLRDACAPETVIIALGTVNDIELLRDLGRAGAADYLVKPVTWETLDESIEKAVREAGGAPGPSAGEQKLGRIVVFVGSRGGAGASTLAMNCAWLMAHEQELRVALVDLDLQFGTLALNLDIEPSHGLVEALQNPSRIDGLFIASAMVNESEQLFVLASEEPIDVAVSFNAEAIDLLFDEMRETFDCIVVDLPRGNLVQSRALLAKAAEVGVVCDLSLPCVRDTMRVLSFLKEAAGDANVSVIANRVRRGAKGQISKRDFERGIETGIDFFIPDDAKAATASANAGKPLPAVAKRSGIVQALRKLELRLSGLSEPKRGILFGKRGTA